ncbi:uncharacterized protein V5649_009053 [Rhynchonycteris naso]
MMVLVLPTLLYLGCLSPPVLTAQPGPMVPSKKSVTILCQGPPEAKEYLLYKVSEPKHTEKRAYEKPSLSSLSGPVVAPRDSVKVQCFSTFKFPEFILTKEDPPHSTLNQSSTPQENGHQAIFHMDHATHTQAGPTDATNLDVLMDTPAGWSISVENQVWLGLAGLILLVLGILVAKAWYSQKRPSHGL